MPTVLITGANRGIGLALARQYLADGWKVIATAREPGDATALSALKGDLSVEALEVTDDEAVADLAGRLAGTPIDLLFNNAGIAGREAGNLGSIDSETWLETFRVNAIAPIKVSEAFVPHVAASGKKQIAFVSSRLGSITLNLEGGRYGYRSSKAALNMAAKSLAVDLKPKGITVIVLHPGHVATDMGGASAPVSPDESASGMRRQLAAATPADTGAFINYDGERFAW